MKKFFYPFLLLFATVFFFACTQDTSESTADSLRNPNDHTVSEQAALSELYAVLGGLEGETRASSRRTVAEVAAVKGVDVLSGTRSADMPDVENLVYIANFENGEGYAILAADDRLEPVIAITEQGTLTPEEFAAVAQGTYDEPTGGVPPVLPEVAAYAAGLGSGGLGGGWTGDIDTGGQFPPIQTYSTYGAWQNASKTGPLVLVKWGQEHPYNYYTPVKSGVHCPVGCVAVALGQIVATNWYGINRQYTGKIGGEVIYWPSIFEIIERYKQSPAITHQRWATDVNDANFNFNIALLLRGIGIEVSMDYQVDKSGSNISKAMDFLKDIGYRDVKKSGYSASYIYTMVNDRRLPVYVSGRDNGKDKGHAWIIDGILTQKRIVKTFLLGDTTPIETRTESRDLFHCNFGWIGKCDGYYTPKAVCNTTVPALAADYGDHSSAGTGECNYSSGMEVITYTGF